MKRRGEPKAEQKRGQVETMAVGRLESGSCARSGARRNATSTVTDSIRPAPVCSAGKNRLRPFPPQRHISLRKSRLPKPARPHRRRYEHGAGDQVGHRSAAARRARRTHRRTLRLDGRRLGPPDEGGRHGRPKTGICRVEIGIGPPAVASCR